MMGGYVQHQYSCYSGHVFLSHKGLAVHNLGHCHNGSPIPSSDNTFWDWKPVTTDGLYQQVEHRSPNGTPVSGK